MFFLPYVLKCVEDYIDVNSIGEIYSLHTFEYSDLNRDKILGFFHSHNYLKSLNVGVLPLGFEDQNCVIGEVMVLKADLADYLAILSNDQSEKEFNYTLKQFEKLSERIDLKQFSFKRLIYPV